MSLHAPRMSIMQIVPLSAFRDNYIWAITSQNQCVIVDPGDAEPVARFLAQQDLRLAAILITHRHNDHIGGVAELLEDWSVPVFGPASISIVTRPVVDGETIQLSGIEGIAVVMSVPGHTEEHLAYRLDEHLFCGDTLFAGGCGRLLGSSTAADLHASLQKIAALPANTKIFCAHEYTLSNLRFAQVVEPGNAALTARISRCNALRDADIPTVPSSLADELATNPFLRVGQAGVRQATEQHTGAKLGTPTDVFAALRAWKDIFR